MKTKEIFAVCLLLVLSTGLFMSAAKADNRKDTVTVEAYVHCMGNEPFIYPGIETVDGKEYFVIADDKIKLELLNNQGRKLLVTGFAMKKGTEFPNLKDGSFEVLEFKVIE